MDDEYDRPSTTESQLLVFDCPPNTSENSDVWYKWVRDDDVPGLHVVEVEYDWKNTIYDTKKACDKW